MFSPFAWALALPQYSWQQVGTLWPKARHMPADFCGGKPRNSVRSILKITSHYVFIRSSCAAALLQRSRRQVALWLRRFTCLLRFL